jgi:Fic family protein
MLFEAAELGEKELLVLKQIEDLKKGLQWRLRQPRRWYGSLRRMAFARAIQGSNTIEGYSAPLDDAVAVGLGEVPLDTDQETALALEGYQTAMTYVLQTVDDPDFAYTEQLLKSLHFMMTRYDLKNRPGKWRSGTVYVRNDKTGEIVHEGSDVDEVPALVGELMETLNKGNELPAIIQAAMAHLNLVMIHPFRDGNGRMARCLQTTVLAREGLLDPVFSSIEEYLGENTQEYYDVLAETGGGTWNPSKGTHSWIHFNLTAHLRQARTSLRRDKEAEMLWSRLEELTTGAELPDRTIVALFDAAMGFRVRSSTYRATFEDSSDEISEQTASRDFRLLVGSGLLVPKGERRGRFYVASSLLADVRKKIIASRDPRDDSDPFADAA